MFPSMKIGIIGGTGFTGRELVRLLRNHSKVKGISLYGRNPGRYLWEEFPELKGLYEKPILPLEPDSILKEVDLLFMALPHKVSMEISPSFQNKIPLIDLSADYRFDSKENFEEWYDVPHQDPEALPHYVYGLVEAFRESIKSAQMIACPGCYPTSILLALLPLLEHSLLKGPIIADSKSGHSGAGKKLTEALHASRIHDNIQPYRVLRHQHRGEIEFILNRLSGGTPFSFSFTPHLMPFDRGILSTVYVDLNQSIDQKGLDALYKERFQKEPFVRLYQKDELPSLKAVLHSNFCDMACVLDEKLNRVTLISCIDNLVKGASGQAIQAMNVMMGFQETEGLLV